MPRDEVIIIISCRALYPSSDHLCLSGRRRVLDAVSEMHFVPLVVSCSGLTTHSDKVAGGCVEQQEEGPSLVGGAAHEEQEQQLKNDWI